jgi:S1-C subfamily serine protease
MLREVSDALIRDGKIVRPWIGITMKSLRDVPVLQQVANGVADGVVVETIEANAPAYKSDLRPADVITAIDGVALREDRDLRREVLRKKIGQKVLLTVWRGGRTLEVPVTTGQLPDEPRRTVVEVAQADAPGAVLGDLGMQLQDVTPDLAQSMGLKVASGALVTSVADAGPAADANLLRDDVITEVDRRPVETAAQCRAIFSKHDSKKGVLLFVDRRGRKTYAVLKITK